RAAAPTAQRAVRAGAGGIGCFRYDDGRNAARSTPVRRARPQRRTVVALDVRGVLATGPQRPRAARRRSRNGRQHRLIRGDAAALARWAPAEYPFVNVPVAQPDRATVS